MLEHLGLKVNRLIRVAYGEFVLGSMKPGQISEIARGDLFRFRKGLK